jgi:hypothetical protein
MEKGILHLECRASSTHSVLIRPLQSNDDTPEFRVHEVSEYWMKGKKGLSGVDERHKRILL